MTLAASPLQSLRARFGSRWLAGFLAAACAIGGAAYLARDAVALCVARGARDLLLVTAPHPYIAAIEWIGGQFVFLSPFLAGAIQIEMVSIWLIVTLPPAFALSFPQSRNRLGSATAALACSFVACCVMLALVAELEIGMVLKEQGLNIVQPWRMEWVKNALRIVGDTLPVAYPVVACIWITRRRSNRQPSEASNAQPNARSTLRQRLVLAGVILTFVAVGTRAQQLAPKWGVAAKRADYVALESWNSNLDTHLVQRGELESAAGRYERAARFFRMALSYGLKSDVPTLARIGVLANEGNPAARALLENRKKLLESQKRGAAPPSRN